MSLLAPLTGHSTPALLIMISGLMLASLARGYSGFGFSALLIASWSIVTEPAKAIALALILEVAASIFQALSVWKDVPWKRVGLLMAGAIIGTPIGVLILKHTDERILRMGIAGFVFLGAMALLAGWKLKARANQAGISGVGFVSGVCNGAVGMGGMPVAIFLTADGDSPKRIRASVVAYFFLVDLAGILFLAREGFVGVESFSLAILALPILLLGMWAGGRHFLGATPEGFRRISLGLLLLLAMIGMARAIWS